MRLGVAVLAFGLALAGCGENYTGVARFMNVIEVDGVEYQVVARQYELDVKQDDAQNVFWVMTVDVKGTRVECSRARSPQSVGCSNKIRDVLRRKAAEERRERDGEGRGGGGGGGGYSGPGAT